MEGSLDMVLFNLCSVGKFPHNSLQVKEHSNTYRCILKSISHSHFVSISLQMRNKQKWKKSIVTTSLFQSREKIEKASSSG